MNAASKDVLLEPIAELMRPEPLADLVGSAGLSAVRLALGAAVRPSAGA
ncbi:hypothetical protein [Rhodoplanes roseus]|nr:hypothetical protein [Rhodoplanes roseus]